MSYPTLEQYNEALQHPKTAFWDNELKNGTVLTTGLGLPLALCGGFALTYCVQSGSKKYAVRCFHKKSNDTESRYKAISNKIKFIQSSYFVNFEFQNTGVAVAGKKAPIVKMAWASGETLGDFIEKNYTNKARLQSLRISLGSLATFLEGKIIAHGDIQPGNVMVADQGKNIQLIDYDGMYVDEIKSLGSENVGHRNFQHPRRDNQDWNAQLDRFSFIELDLALRVLESEPLFWNETKSDGDSILFRANDFADPGNSMLFSKLFGITEFYDDAMNFAAICRAQFDKIPTLEDFIAKKNIPQVSISISPPSTVTIQPYIGAFSVLNAEDYGLCLKHVGNRVELIGKIKGVFHGRTKYRSKRFIFINFGVWNSGESVKIAIWSEGIAVLTNEPDQSWKGKWITVTGLMEPPFKGSGYTHLSINITQSNQLRILPEQEAHYRLGISTSVPIVVGPKPDGNTVTKPTPISPKPTISPIKNIDVSVAIRTQLQKTPQMPHQPTKSQSPQTPPQSTTPSRYPSPRATSQNKSGCFIASAIYGPYALETSILREWRDKKLLLYLPGRMLTCFYYFVSPPLSKLITRHETFKMVIRKLLDAFIVWISR